MLLKKRATKIVAIVSAICLLLAGVVTGTVFALNNNRVEAVEIGTATDEHAPSNVITVVQPQGVTIYLSNSSDTSLENILSTAASGDGGQEFAKAMMEGSSFSYIKKSAETEYELGVSETASNSIYYLYYSCDNTVGKVTGQISGANNMVSVSEYTNTPARIMMMIKTWEASKLTLTPAAATRKISIQNDSVFTFTQAKSATEVGESAKSAASFDVPQDQEFYFTITPKDESMAIESVSVFGETLTPNEHGIYTIHAGASDVSILAVRGYKVEKSEESDKEGYTTSITDGTIVALNAKGYSFRVTPEEGYTVTVTATVGEKAVTVHKDGNTYSFDDTVTGKVVVTIKATPAQYTITYVNDGHAKVVGTTQGKPTYNQPFTFTVTPDFGYEISSITYTIGNGDETSIEVGDADKGQAKQCTIDGSAIKGNITVTVTTTAKSYTVKYAGADNVTVSPEAGPELKAKTGEEFSFTAAPKAGYTLTNLTVRVGSLNVTLIGSRVEDGEGHYSFTLDSSKLTNNPTADTVGVTITFTTKAIERTVTFVGDNVTFPTNRTATIENDYTFTLTAAAGYELGEVKYTVVGGEQGEQGEQLTAQEDGSYKIDAKNIKGDITINVSATAKKYEVTISPSIKEGLIGSSSAGNATYNEIYSFTLQAAENYRIVKVTATSGTVAITVTEGDTTEEGKTTYTIDGSQLKGAVIVNVTVEKYIFNVRTEGDGFEFAGAGTITKGADYTFTVTAKAPNAETHKQYKIDSVSAEYNEKGLAVTANGSDRYTIGALSTNNITDDVTITVKTIEVKSTLTFTKQVGFQYTGVRVNGDEQSITENKLSVGYMSTVTFTLKAMDGYTLRDVTVENATATIPMALAMEEVEKQFTVADITSDKDITVENVKHVYTVKDGSTAKAHYTIEVGLEDALEDIAEGKQFVEGDTITVKVTHEPGYKFQSVMISSTDITNGAGNATYKVTEDIAIKVVLIENRYTVTYQANGKTTSQTIKYSEFTEETKALNGSEYEYYTVKWTQEESADAAAVESISKSDIADENKTLNVYGHYSLDQNTILTDLVAPITVNVSVEGQIQEGNSATAKLLICLSTDESTSNNSQWKKFFDSLRSNGDKVVAMGVIMAACNGGNTQGKFENVTAANLYDGYVNEIRSKLISDSVANQEGRGLLWGENNCMCAQNRAVAYGIYLGNMEQKYTLRISSEGGKLMHRALCPWVAVQLDGQIVVIKGEFKATSEYAPKAAAAALLPQDSAAEQERYEEPTIE